MVDYTNQVKSGMQFLDEKVPGWQDSVNPSTLDMSRGTKCVLGQVYDGGYDEGVKDLLLDLEKRRDYGFLIDDRNTTLEQDFQEYEVLTAVWKKALFTLAVKRGAALLDEKAPAGWRKRINLYELDMHEGTSCVAAQAFDTSYLHACELLNISTYSGGIQYGFYVDTDSTMTMREDNENFDLLGEAWKEYLRGSKSSV